jgi:hypothetical protein
MKMGKLWNTMKFQLKLYKEGALIGAAVGAGAAWYVLSQGTDLTSVTEAGKTLLDNFMSRSETADVVKYKIYGTFITIGAVVGLYLDMFISRHLSRRRGGRVARRSQRRRKR